LQLAYKKKSKVYVNRFLSLELDSFYRNVHVSSSLMTPTPIQASFKYTIIVYIKHKDAIIILSVLTCICTRRTIADEHKDDV